MEQLSLIDCVQFGIALNSRSVVNISMILEPLQKCKAWNPHFEVIKYLKKII